MRMYYFRNCCERILILPLMPVVKRLLGEFDICVLDFDISAVPLNITVFWDEAPCSLVKFCQRLLKISENLYHFFYPEDGGSMSFRNIDELLPDYVASHPRKSTLM